MATHAMIDIETLDTQPSSVVLSVGAVKFDPFTNQEPFAKTLWRPSVDEQLAAGRTTSESTLEWWSRQEAHIRESTFTEQGRVDLIEFFKDLNKFLVGVDKVWCQGPQFDMVILEDLFKHFKHHMNWAYWQVCDCRTIFNMMPADPRKAIQQNLHSAEEDAFWQAVCVQQTFGHFNVLPR